MVSCTRPRVLRFDAWGRRARPRAVLRRLGVLLAVAAGSWGAMSGTTGVAAGEGASPEEASIRRLLHDGRVAEAEEAAEQRLAVIDRRSGPDSIEVAAALDLLVECRLRRGKATDPETLRQARRTLQLKERHLDAGHASLAISLENLSDLWRTIGDYEAARGALERAIGILEQSLPAHDPQLTTDMRKLAAILVDTGDYAEARKVLEEAVSRVEGRAGPEDPELAPYLQNLASLVKRMGDLTGARVHYERALAMLESIHGTDGLELVGTLIGFADLHYELADAATAISFLERALAIQESKPEQTSLYLANTLNYLAMMVGARGEHERAAAYIERAIDEQVRTRGPRHRDVAASLVNYANLLNRMGKYAEALRCVEDALRILQENLGRTHNDVAWALAARASIHVATGDYAKALKDRRECLRIYSAVHGPRSRHVAARLPELAALEWKAGDRRRALENALRAESIAREHFQLTVRLLAEREALRYEDVRFSGLDTALSVLAEGGDAGAVERVWTHVARSRAMVLDELASRHRTARRETDPRIASLKASLDQARSELSDLIVRGPAGQDAAAHAEALALLTARKEQAERDLAAVSVAFRRRLRERDVALDEIRAALPPRTALVAYVRYERLPDETPSYLAFILASRAAKPTIASLGPARIIDARVEEWAAAVGSPPGLARGASAAEDRYRTVGGRLRQAIWDPVEAQLGDSSQVIVVPDGPIHLVSFASLPLGKDRYLIESGRLIHYASAERDLLAEAGVPRGDRLLAMGGADFDASSGLEVSGLPIDLAASGGTLYRGPTSGCDEFQAMRFGALPGSEKEVEEIAEAWRARPERTTGPVTKLTGGLANEALFKRLAPTYGVLHLATHGFAIQDRCAAGASYPRAAASAEEVPENPLVLSGLALAGANRRDGELPAGEDGILTAEEIATLDLSDVSWVVLSACQTGVGRIQNGEGVLGLRRAFRLAGASTTIMSLWSVEDEATREWMRGLYEARLTGSTTIEAVSRAGRRVLRERRRREDSTHPFFWAGFVAAGEWR